MAEVMSINTEAVGAAINQISVYTADIATRNKKFLELLNEKNQATQGKFTLLKTLENKLTEESHNFDALIGTQEEIKDALNKYAELAEEANDDHAFRS